MGFKKFDKVGYLGHKLFIKGRMSTGYAKLMDIDGKTVDFKPIPKLTKLRRLTARKSYLISQTHIENPTDTDIKSTHLICKECLTCV